MIIFPQDISFQKKNVINFNKSISLGSITDINLKFVQNPKNNKIHIATSPNLLIFLHYLTLEDKENPSSPYHKFYPEFIFSIERN